MQRRTTPRGASEPAAPAEEQLIRRAQAGDAAAFGQLYEAHFAAIYRYGLFRVSDDQTAEDIAGQVFLKAWEHLDSYRISESPLLAWLYTIAHNEVIAWYRKGNDRVVVDDVEKLAATDQSEQQVQLNLDLEAARQALQDLTEDQRQVLILKFIEGRTTRETAHLMGKEEGAIRALQMRGLQALAQLLAEPPGAPLEGEEQHERS